MGASSSALMVCATAFLVSGCINLPEISQTTVSQEGCELVTASTTFKTYALRSASIKCGVPGAGSNEHRLTGCGDFGSKTILFAAGSEISAGTVEVRVTDGAGTAVVTATLVQHENATSMSKALTFSETFTIQTQRSADFVGEFGASVNCRGPPPS